MTQIQRTHFAAGDYLTRYPAGHKYELRIDASFEKPGWKARTFSPAGQSIFPGSAVEFEEKYYEVVFLDYEPGPPLRICYYLNRWDDLLPIRVQFHYNKQECRNAAIAYSGRVKNNRQRVLLTIFSPVIGMLPAEDQIRIANQYGMEAQRMTFFSALVLLAPSAFFILFLASHLFGRVPLPGPPRLHWIYPSGFYFLAESLLRMLTATKLEEPVGSIILSVPVLIWRSVRQLFDPAAAQKKFENLQPVSEKERSLLTNARDQVIPSGDGQHVEIISVLPKPHWNSRLGIGLNGAWYGLIETERLKLGNDVSHRFVLRKAPEGMWFASVIEYNPDEVQTLYRNKRRTDLKTWVDTFALFWGLLSLDDQTRLENLYDFDSLKFTRLTFIVISIVASVNLLVSGINLLAGVGKAFDVWLLLPAGFLLLESFSRWKEWKSGKPSGSVLGVLFRPFARKLLQGS